MNAEFLRELGVAEKAIPTILAENGRDVSIQGTRLAAQLVRTTVEALPTSLKAPVSDYMTGVTPERAEDIVRVSRKTIMQAVADGKIVAVQGSTGRWKIEKSSLLEWAAERTPSLPSSASVLSSKAA